MKLLKCYVGSFGKLQDFSFDFSSGLNTINQENGWGKSTLSTFIKAMFYGLEDSKKGIDGNERKKFRSWNSEKTIGGYVDFETNGKKIRVKKSFGKKSSEDEVSVYDLNLAKDITDEFENPFEIGKYFLNIDLDAFKSTLHFSQKDLTVSGSESLSACITPEYNLGEGNSVEMAVESLENQAKKYKKQRGDGGYIFEGQKQLVEIDEKIEIAKEGINSYNSILREIKALENKIMLTKENLKLYANKKDLMQKYQNQKAILDDIARKKQLLQEKINLKKEILQTLGKEDVTLFDVENFSKLVKEYELMEQKIQSLENEVEKLLSISTPKVEKKKVFPVFIMATSMVLLIVSVITFAVSQIVVGGVLAMLGIVGLVSSVLLKDKKGKESDNGNSTILIEIENDKRQLENLATEKEKKFNCIQNFLSQFKISFNDYFDFENIVRKALLEVSQLERIIDYTKSEIDGLQTKVEKIDFDTIEGEDCAVINERYAFFNKAFNTESVELARSKEQSKRYDEYIINLPRLESEKSNLLEKIVDLKKEYELYVKTAKFLTEADNELKKKYRQPLEDRLNKYIEKIEGGKVGNVKVDTDLNVFVEKDGALLDSAYFSQGYKNLFCICERFALIDMLFDGGKPFVVLDDPFTNLDKDKIKQALSLVKELSKEFQIIYFVCHESRM